MYKINGIFQNSTLSRHARHVKARPRQHEATLRWSTGGSTRQRLDTITRRQPTTRQAAAPHHYSYRKSCPGRGKHAHNRNECSAWGKQCMKYGKSHHFANVCRSSMANTHLVPNTTQLADDVNLCDETYALRLYKCNTATTDRHIIVKRKKLYHFGFLIIRSNALMLP